MSLRRWLRSLHAVTALVLMVLFFAVAASAGAGLVYAGVELGSGVLTHVRGRGLIMMALVCLALIGAGLVVLWSLLPRFDRFVAPGPELLPTEHPALFREIERVAAMTFERAPRHVYLVGDVNAFVAERGGLMGIGSQRVMGIGLPLLSVLTVSELRGVLAHEFGHFVGGDTRLGKWIYKTRAALIRTLDNLGSAANGASEVGEIALVFTMVHAPFRWFFAFYMRFTQALSRAQEYDADALAVRLEGTHAFVEGMKKVERASIGYAAYVDHELAPLLRRGFLPPLAAGFRHFMGAPLISTRVDAASTRALADAEADPLDSHPPARDRIAAALRLATPPRSSDDRLSLELLGDVARLEAAVAKAWVDDAALQPIAWEQSNAPLEAQWKENAKSYAHHFIGVTLAGLPTDPAALRTLAERQHGERARGMSDGDARGWAGQAFSVVLFVMLLEHGFVSTNLPGRVTTFARGAVSIEAGRVLGDYLDGTLDAAGWQAQLAALGVADLDVSQLGA